MARIHAEQGNIQKAQEIYTGLMAKEPDAQDLVEALADLSRRVRNRRILSLEPLIKSWARLTVQYLRTRKGTLPISI